MPRSLPPIRLASPPGAGHTLLRGLKEAHSLTQVKELIESCDIPSEGEASRSAWRLVANRASLLNAEIAAEIARQAPPSDILKNRKAPAEAREAALQVLVGFYLEPAEEGGWQQQASLLSDEMVRFAQRGILLAKSEIGQRFLQKVREAERVPPLLQPVIVAMRDAPADLLASVVRGHDPKLILRAIHHSQATPEVWQAVMQSPRREDYRIRSNLAAHLTARQDPKVRSWLWRLIRQGETDLAESLALDGRPDEAHRLFLAWRKEQFPVGSLLEKFTPAQLRTLKTEEWAEMLGSSDLEEREDALRAWGRMQQPEQESPVSRSRPRRS